MHIDEADKPENTQTTRLDIAANRQARKYSRGEMLLRVLWSVGQQVFVFSPRTAFGFRRWWLRLFGAKIGNHVHIYPSARIVMPWNLVVGDEAAIGEDVLIYNLGKIEIGDKATLSHRAHLCAGTHDYECASLPLIKPPIVIGAQSWVCADAFIAPGVTVGEGSVVGARAVATNDVADWTVVAGNPARVVKKRVLHEHA